MKKYYNLINYGISHTVVFLQYLKQRWRPLFSKLNREKTAAPSTPGHYYLLIEEKSISWLLGASGNFFFIGLSSPSSSGHCRQRFLRLLVTSAARGSSMYSVVSFSTGDPIGWPDRFYAAIGRMYGMAAYTSIIYNSTWCVRHGCMQVHLYKIEF